MFQYSQYRPRRQLSTAARRPAAEIVMLIGRLPMQPVPPRARAAAVCRALQSSPLVLQLRLFGPSSFRHAEKLLYHSFVHRASNTPQVELQWRTDVLRQHQHQWRNRPQSKRESHSRAQNSKLLAFCSLLLPLTSTRYVPRPPLLTDSFPVSPSLATLIRGSRPTEASVRGPKLSSFS